MNTSTIDTAFGGLTTLNVVAVSGNVTLTSSQYVPPNIRLSGLLSANITYQFPSGVGGFWSVTNATTGAFSVTFASLSSGASATVTVAQGVTTAIKCDTTNGVAVWDNSTNLAAGSNTYVQFNSSGVLAGSANLTFNGSALGLTGALNQSGNASISGSVTGGSLVLNGSSSGAVTFQAAASTTVQTYTLPPADGTNGQVLTTNGSHVLSWTTVSSSTGVSSFSAGSTGLTPNSSTTGAITLGGTLGVANGGTGKTNFSAGLVTASGTSAFSSVAAPTGTVVGTSDTQTLTNKRVTRRIQSTTSGSTITPTSDTADQYEVTALATNPTIAAPSGTPTDGQPLLIRITDNGTPRTLTWNGVYHAQGVSLPTTTVASTPLYVGCFYNGAASAWDVVAVS